VTLDLGLDLAEVQRIVFTALGEDLGDPPRDVTSEATIPAEQVDTAELVARADGVVAGLVVAAEVFAITSAGAATFDPTAIVYAGGTSSP
jgi:nicotinate-nucleotide pyrophosphorylase (carboxylating)